MSGKPGTKRSHRVIVFYSDEEFEELKKKYARSTSRTFSHYVRKVSIEEPILMVVRNGSFDAFTDEMVFLRKTMMEIFREGSLSPTNQERLVQLYQEIKLKIDKIAEICMPS